MTPTEAGLMSIAMVGGLLVSSIVTGRIITGPACGSAGSSVAWCSSSSDSACSARSTTGPTWRSSASSCPSSASASARPCRTSCWRCRKHRAVRHGRRQLGRRLLPLDGRLDRRLGARRRARPPGRQTRTAAGLAAARRGGSWPAREPLDIPDLDALPSRSGRSSSTPSATRPGHLFLVALPFAMLALVCVLFIKEAPLRTTVGPADGAAAEVTRGRPPDEHEP